MASITYLPTEYINSNYRYSISQDSITIITDNNCYNQYNNTYCDCFDVFPKYNYITNTTTSCYISGNYINSNQFIDDWHYRSDAPFIILYASFYIILTMFIFLILLKVFRKALHI